MAEEVNYDVFINFVGRVKNAKEVVQEAEKTAKEMEQAFNKGGATPQTKNVEQTAGAYEKLNQSINSHKRVIGELQKLQGGDQLAQRERLSIIKEITQARANGTVQEGAFQEQLKQTSDSYNQVNEASKKTLISIARWAIGWTAVYGVMRGLRSAITSTIKDMLQLEQQIYRAISASRFERGGAIPSGDEVRQLKDVYTRELWGLIRDTSIQITSTGEALYFLSTAGLTTREALSALSPVIDLTVAAFGNLEEISRLVASSYNVFSNQLQGFTDTQEKMEYITDVIAYAYRNQQIELSELSSAMEFSAQISGVMNVEFKDLVGTLGFLSTGLLRGSKGGTSLFNALLQIADKSDTLRDKLGIVFDSSKPLDYVDLMTQLHNRFGDNTLSLEDMNVLFDIFGRRGGRAIAEILNRWGDWQDAINITKEGVKGTAEEIRNLVEESTISKMHRLANESKRFIAAFTDTGAVRSFIDFLSNSISDMADKLTYLADKQKVVAEWGKTGAWQHGTWAATQEKWAANVIQLYDSIDRDVKSGAIPEEISEKLKKRANLELQSIHQTREGYKGKALSMEELARVYTSILRTGDKWTKQQVQEVVVSKETESVNYQLVQSFKALQREAQLNKLQMIGFSEAELNSYVIGAKLSNLYSDLANNVANANKSMKEGDTAINLPSYETFASRISDIASAFQRSPESGAKAFEVFREEMGKASLPLSSVSDILKDVAKQPLQQSIASWAVETRNFDSALKDLRLSYNLQEDILRTLGARQNFVSKSNLEAIQEEVDLIRQRNEAYLKQPHIAKLSVKEQSKLPEVIKQREELADAERNATRARTADMVVSYQRMKELQQEYFKSIEADREAYYSQQELQLQIEQAGERETLELQKQKTVEQMTYVRNQQYLLSVMEPLNETERKSLENQLIALGHSKKEIELRLKLYDVNRAIELKLESMTRYESELEGLGYNNVDIAKRMLVYLSLQDEIKGEQLRKLQEQYSLELQRAELAERMKNIQLEMSVQEESVSGWSNVSEFVGVLKREEMLNGELDMARQLGDVQRENYLLEELKVVQFDKQKAILTDMRGIMGGITDSVYGLITGTEDWKGVMDNLNKVVLKKSLDILAEMLFKMLQMKLIGLIGGIFAGGGGGGGVGASTGDWNIPTGISVSAAGGGIMPNKETVAKLHPKEMVLPSDISDFVISASKNQSGQSKQSEPVEIINVFSDDFIVGAVSRRPNAIINVISQDVLRNGITRRTMHRGL